MTVTGSHRSGDFVDHHMEGETKLIGMELDRIVQPYKSWLWKLSQDDLIVSRVEFNVVVAQIIGKVFSDVPTIYKMVGSLPIYGGVETAIKRKRGISFKKNGPPPRRATGKYIPKDDGDDDGDDEDIDEDIDNDDDNDDEDDDDIKDKIYPKTSPGDPDD